MKVILQYVRQKIVALTIICTCISLVWITTNISFGKDDWRGIIESDAKGYYAYLPAIFIYNDLNFGFFEETEKGKYFQPHIYVDYRSKVGEKYVNKYYVGTAVAQTPFFLLAHLITSFSDEPADGYSKYYMLSIPLAAICYHIFGLIFLAKLLSLFRIKSSLIAFLLLCCSFGTHLFIYTISEVGMSHVYSFELIAAFLYYCKKFFNQPSLNSILLSTVLLGLIVLCRPINFLIVLFLIPLSGSIGGLLSSLKSYFTNFKYLILSILIFSAIISIQLIIYKISTGSFLVYSYVEEGFNFLEPNFFKILFSYQKGLFLYTPMLFISIVAIPFLAKTKAYFSISWLSVFILITYVFSSWWMWFYGGSFSSRVYVEYIPIFFLPIALWLNQMNKVGKKWILATMTVLLLICQVQSYQYRYYEIHYSEMNKAKYWEVFLMRNKL